MPYEIFLALRHLRSRQRRRMARATSLIAIVGITVGVAALIVALALANGFRDEMRDKILRGTAHLTVMRSDGQPISDYKEIAGRIAGVPGVVSATGTTYDGAVIVGKRASAYAVLRGIDGFSKGGPAGIDQAVPGATSPQQTEIGGTVIEGSASELFDEAAVASDFAPVVLGSELAARTGLKVGDVAQIVGTRTGFSSTTESKRNVHVVGIFRLGLFEYDSTWIYLPLETASTISGEAHAAAVVGVQVGNIYDVKATAAQVKQLLGSSYTTVDWQEANRPLFTALALERRIGVVIIGLIIFIAALNITTTLILVVVERRRDIAILNTMGATTRSIMSIFVIEGAIVGLLGAAGGVLLGAIAVLIANHYQLISLPADVYSISNVPLSLNVRDLSLAALVAFVLSVLATVYPARTAARIRPAEMLRDAN